MFRSSLVLTGALSLLLLLGGGDAFQHSNLFRSVSNVPRNTLTQLHVFGFLNEGKKALVKSLAGEYDAGAIRARMDGLIDANSVFMFSFTT